jgi:hypothetical protein
MNITEIIQIIGSLNWLEIIGATTTLLVTLIAVFELVPGDQPEKFLKAVVQFLARFSRK